MLVYVLNYLQGLLVCTVFTMLHLLPKITKKKCRYIELYLATKLLILIVLFVEIFPSDIVFV